MITNLNSNLFRPNIIYIILKFGQVYKWFKTMVGIQKNHPLIRKKYIKLSINQTSQLELIYAKEKYHAQMNKMVVWCCSCLASRGSNLAHRWFDIYIHTTFLLGFGWMLQSALTSKSSKIMTSGEISWRKHNFRVFHWCDVTYHW